MALDRPKMAQNGPQQAPKKGTKMAQREQVFYGDSCLVASCAPTGPKLTPRWPQEAPNMAPRWPRKAPRWPQEAPRWPQEALRLPQKRPLGAILVSCLATLDEKVWFSEISTAPRRERIFPQSWRPSWGHFGATLGQVGPT